MQFQRRPFLFFGRLLARLPPASSDDAVEEGGIPRADQEPCPTNPVQSHNSYLGGRASNPGETQWIMSHHAGSLR